MVTVGGFFDNQTSADERRTYLLKLLEAPTATSVNVSDSRSHVETAGQAEIELLDDRKHPAASMGRGSISCCSCYSNDDLNHMLSRVSGELQVLQAGDMRSNASTRRPGERVGRVEI